MSSKEKSLQAKQRKRDRGGQFADENKRRIPHANHDSTANAPYCHNIASDMIDPDCSSLKDVLERSAGYAKDCFDMDGALADYVTDLNHALEPFGITVAEDGTTRRTVGKFIDDGIVRFAAMGVDVNDVLDRNDRLEDDTSACIGDENGPDVKTRKGDAAWEHAKMNVSKARDARTAEESLRLVGMSTTKILFSQQGFKEAENKHYGLKRDTSFKARLRDYTEYAGAGKDGRYTANEFQALMLDQDMHHVLAAGEHLTRQQASSLMLEACDMSFSPDQETERILLSNKHLSLAAWSGIEESCDDSQRQHRLMLDNPTFPHRKELEAYLSKPNTED